MHINNFVRHISNTVGSNKILATCGIIFYAVLAVGLVPCARAVWHVAETASVYTSLQLQIASLVICFVIAGSLFKALTYLRRSKAKIEDEAVTAWLQKTPERLHAVYRWLLTSTHYQEVCGAASNSQSPCWKFVEVGTLATLIEEYHAILGDDPKEEGESNQTMMLPLSADSGMDWRELDICDLKTCGDVIDALWAYKGQRIRHFVELFLRVALGPKGVKFKQHTELERYAEFLHRKLQSTSSDWEIEVVTAVINCCYLNNDGRVQREALSESVKLFSYCWSQFEGGNQRYLDAVTAIGIATKVSRDISKPLSLDQLSLWRDLGTFYSAEITPSLMDSLRSFAQDRIKEGAPV